MGKHNKNRFRGTTIYTEDYLMLAGLKRTPDEPIASVVHSLIRRKEPVKTIQPDTSHPVVAPSNLLRRQEESTVSQKEASKEQGEVPKEVRAWFQKCRKLGTGVYKFTSTCQVIAHCDEKQAEEWFEMLKKEEASK